MGDDLNMTAAVEEIPLARDAHSVFRVGGARVTLDLVVRAFNRGARPRRSPRSTTACGYVTYIRLSVIT
jgi:hypothetical protein